MTQLTTEQKETFREQGFLRLPSFYSLAGIDHLLNAFRATENNEKTITVYEKGNSSQLCRMENFVEEDRNLGIARRQLSEPISQLFGEDATPFKEKLNYKRPGGGAFEPHQDHEAYRHFAPNYFITAMIALDNATPENGCLKFDPHYKESLKHLESVDQQALANGRALLPTTPTDDIHPDITQHLHWDHITVNKGDVLIFDSYVPHTSESNNSDKSRRAAFFTYNRTSDGDHHDLYYALKTNIPKHPMFHVGTPTEKETPPHDLSVKQMLTASIRSTKELPLEHQSNGFTVLSNYYEDVTQQENYKKGPLYTIDSGSYKENIFRQFRLQLE